jgi:hypothetical protein
MKRLTTRIWRVAKTTDLCLFLLFLIYYMSEWFNTENKRAHKQKKTPPWLWSASELCRPSDRRFLAK